MPAWKEASVRSDGLKNTSPRILLASARGSGLSCSACASASRSRTCSRLKSGEIKKALHADIFARASLKRIHVAFVQDVGRQQTQNVRIAAGAGEDVLGHAAPPELPWPDARSSGPTKIPRPARP